MFLSGTRPRGTPASKKYVHTSAIKVATEFSLARALILYRTLGLRAIVVVDENNIAVGMLTRQDLLPFHVNSHADRQADAAACGLARSITKESACGDDDTVLEAAAAIELADLV